MLSSIGSTLTSAWANGLFAKLDTQNQGYINKAGLRSAFSRISDGSNSSSSADDIFTRLDGNNDGKPTKDEMAAALQSIFDQLDSRFSYMRTNGDGHGGPGGPGGMPPLRHQKAKIRASPRKS